MADKESSFGEIKKAVIGVVTLAITTAGGLLIANMEKIFDSNDEVKQELVSEKPEEVSKDTIVVVQQLEQKKEPAVAIPVPKAKKKEFEW